MTSIDPRSERKPALRIAGLRKNHRVDDHMFVEVATQWEEFGPLIPRVANKVGHSDFGLCFDMTGKRTNFDYFTGVEVTPLDGVKQPFAGVTLPPEPYAEV